MESPEADNIKYDTSWTAVTGSLEDYIIFESSLSLFDNGELSSTAAVDSSAAKPPLVLCPTSPDHSSPCEITINFAQKHEVHQVYVRSSSRVYEIYCSSGLNSGNEYLCTVRCGIAARDEEVLRAAIDIEEAALAYQKGNTSGSAEEKLRNGSNVSSNEDDWVEVKVVDSPVVVNANSSSSNGDASQPRSSQPLDLYEATAEISDADPCTSITLRLLSLQNKGYVCIDEIYVFADPVVEADLDSKVGPLENSAGSSLMTMLMPTLLQLSRTKGVVAPQVKHDSGISNGQKPEEVQAKPSVPIDAGSERPLKMEDYCRKDAAQQVDGSGSSFQHVGSSGSSFQQDVQFLGAGTPIAKPLQPEMPPRESDSENTPETSHNHIKSVLDQLVSRVGRIEDLFLRFEDCMLKPMRSIDERLQRVEQQLEVLTKKPQFSGTLSCTRISAPEFSCSESETNSLHNSGCMDPSFAACETIKNDSFPAVSSIHSDATAVSENITNLYPSLLVTAPEFPTCDSDEDNVVDATEESSLENQRHVVSIDDALASALANFLSSTLVETPGYSRSLSIKAPDFPSDEGNSNDETVYTEPSTSCGDPEVTGQLGKYLAVKAPDFPNEEGNSNDGIASPKSPCERFTATSTGFSESEGTEQVESVISALSNVSSLHSNENAMRSPNTNKCMRVGRQVDEFGCREGGDNNSGGSCNLTASSENDMFVTSPYQVFDGSIIREAGSGTITKGTKTDSVELHSIYQTDDGADATEEVAAPNDLNTRAEVLEEGCDQNILQNVVELSRASVQVDFETPILEVKFACQGNLNSSSPLEALLAGIPGMNVEEVKSMKGSNRDDSRMDPNRT